MSEYGIHEDELRQRLRIALSDPKHEVRYTAFFGKPGVYVYFGRDQVAAPQDIYESVAAELAAPTPERAGE